MIKLILIGTLIFLFMGSANSRENSSLIEDGDVITLSYKCLLRGPSGGVAIPCTVEQYVKNGSNGYLCIQHKKIKNCYYKRVAFAYNV